MNRRPRVTGGETAPDADVGIGAIGWEKADEGLCEFKRGIGLADTSLPTRAWSARGADGPLRDTRPQEYCRLTGRG